MEPVVRRVLQTDVIIRADGGVGLPLPVSKLIIRNDQPDCPLLLVDVDDRHHALLWRWSRARQGAYEDRGWLASGVDPIMARVDRFLAGGGEVKP